MRTRAGVFICKWIAVILSLVGPACTAAWPQQMEEQGETSQAQAADESSDRTNAVERGKNLLLEPQESSSLFLTKTGKDFLFDQKQIWTSPARLRFSDAQWLLPIGGLAAGLFATDRDFSAHLSQNPHTLSHYNTVSNAGVAGLVGAAGGLTLLSLHTHNSHWRETGLLAGEAAVDSLVATEALKYTFARERPFQGNGSGRFFSAGTSFPSEHAAAAWSVAGVIAHEYPGPVPKLLAYGLASFVSYSRVRSRQHYSSDVFVGGLLGNMVAQEVYSSHHDPELGGASWDSIGEIVRHEANVSPSSSGTTFVPLDSWVYPVLERLAALGYINVDFLGMRPWTRLECARLVQDAGNFAVTRDSDPAGAGAAVEELEAEFAKDLDVLGGGSNRRIQLESVYTRLMDISGQPLNDSNHFGQTLINDFGRPYGEGFNNSTGFSGYATAGRFSLYVRGEYQHATPLPAYSLPVRQVIASVDANPLQPAQSVAAVDRFELLDTYVGANFANWEFTFGKQSLWWGPGEGGALLFSDNAEPITMGRLSRIAPFTLPWLFRLMGPVKLDLFFGKLSGHQFPPDPFIHGEKISFKPTPNLELGFSRTVVMGGVGRPFTLGALFNSYVSFTSSQSYGASVNPGKRTGGFDFSYRVPFVRNWLTIYSDSLSDDDPSPLAAPRRSGVSPGIYLTRIPAVPKLDLRVEGVNTDPPTRNSHGGQFIYFDTFYHDLYTNNKNIIGSWIGREGQGLQAWSRYWFTSRNSLQFGYRHAKVNGDFIPGGGTVNDASVQLDFLAHHSTGISTRVQYELWNYPILAPRPQTNVTFSLTVTHWPRERTK
jgi:membrane-associated phospholipid phosphatase